MRTSRTSAAPDSIKGPPSEDAVIGGSVAATGRRPCSGAADAPS
jgi:hypothetical protein